MTEHILRMRKLVVFGSQNLKAESRSDNAQTVLLDGISARFGVLEDPPLSFDPQDPANKHFVLVHVRAFSLNFRDKTQILKTTCKAESGTCYAIGSEFAGDVLAVGSEASRFSPGDRVMGNNAYPDSGVPTLLPGVPTNHASRELQILHEHKLFKMPSEMPYEEAAAFSIGAQTCYGMLRRLAPKKGAKVLVTAAKSNTSLFAIRALHIHGACVYATSTSNSFDDRLRKLGLCGLAVCQTNEPFHTNTTLARALETGAFDAVIDPYMDLHLGRSLDVLRMGGKYISCGFFKQYLHLTGQAQPEVFSRGNESTNIILKNLSVTGNCLGSEDDLRQACEDYSRGIFKPVIDSVFSGDEVADFIHRTYVSSQRFGKVVYRYQ